MEPIVVNGDCTNVLLTGRLLTFWVNFGWYTAGINGSLDDCPVKTYILLLSAGF